MRIYLDTDLWNALCDEAVEPCALLADLDRHGATLTLGIHVIYEVLKSFAAGKRERGQQLFTYIDEHLKAGLRCVSKDVFEALVAEMFSLKGATGAEKFLSFGDLQKISAEVERLAVGDVMSEWYEHISEQQAAAKLDRTQVRDGLAQRPSHRQLFQNVTPEKVKVWLQQSTNTAVGQDILLTHLRQRFPSEPVAELQEYSNRLLREESRTASALVKADLYYAWRCAHRGSNPPDLLDDMYHVLSSCYCDVYATGERKQAEYASHLLRNDVRVCTYDRSFPIDVWLRGIAGSRR